MPFSTTVVNTIKSLWFGSMPKNSIAALLDNMKPLVGQVKIAVIAGGAAGNHTVTGIAVGDELIAVLRMIGAGTDVTDVAELASEFTVSAANTINNTGGTDTTGSKLVVAYLDLT